TIDPTAQRFHLVEVSQTGLEKAIAHLETLELDFLLIPGDLTQDGEPENHQWLQQRLQKLPFPAYVIPGNHDLPVPKSSDRAVGLDTFTQYYSHCGYQNPQQIYYRQEVFAGVQLIGLNSNGFDLEGKQIGHLDSEQLVWLETELQKYPEDLILITIHHNIIEHLPGQSHHELGRRYMLDNAPNLLKLLNKYHVKLIFTGHLHVQDIAHHNGIYEITTGSLVSYPHPYRVITCHQEQENWHLDIESYRLEQVENFTNLAEYSRQFLGDRSYFFMMRLLTLPPLNLPKETAEKMVPSLRYFWADVAEGDGKFDFPDFPAPLRSFLKQFSGYNHPEHLDFEDNNTSLKIQFRGARE
ncbi:MAG: metallophosphoesterase family protein, partial [Microcystaceae cyanobacterium]